MKKWMIGVVAFVLLACFGGATVKIEVCAQSKESEYEVTNVLNGEKSSQENMGEALSGTCGAQGDNLTWHLDEEGTLTISGNGEMADYEFYENNPPWYVYKGAITSVIINTGVTSIGNDSFCEHKNLINITMPDTLTRIGDGAFSGCSSLSGTLRIPKNVTYIGDSAFNGCLSLSGDLVLPNGLTSIEPHVFGGCSCEGSLYLPEGITVIGEGAFCESAFSGDLIIPDGVLRIEDFAFGYCPSLSGKVYIPKSIKYIADDAFNLCPITDIYYAGSAEEWEDLNKRDDYGALSNATIHFNSSIGSLSEDSICFSGISKNQTVDILYPKLQIITAQISNAGNLDETDITWTSSNNSAVKITDTYFFREGNTGYAGVTLKCVGDGYADITLRVSDGREEKLQVICYKPSTTGVFISTSTGESGPIHTKVGSKIHLNAIVDPPEQLDKTVKWCSDNTDVATVNQSGMVTIKKGGTATIYARSGDVTDSITFLVSEKKILDYSNFQYHFGNNPIDFNYGKNYAIPLERYMQIGCPYPLANALCYLNKWSGSCFGMSASSVLFYMDILQEEKYNDYNAHVPYDLHTPDTNLFYEKKLREMIELLQVTIKSFDPTINVYASSINNHWFFNSLDDIVEQLDNGIPVVLGLKCFKNGEAAGGHAVVIYGYSCEGYSITFNIYDCSGFIDHLTYSGVNDWSFEPYLDHEFDLEPFYICLYGDIRESYYKLLYQNSNNAASLLKSPRRNIGAALYLFTPAVDMTIANNTGVDAVISNGELTGDTEGVRLVPSEVFAEEPSYTIITPMDDYTVVGPESLSVANDVISIEVAASGNTPISFTRTLFDVCIEENDGNEFSVNYTTYDNIYDKLTINGTSAGVVDFNLSDDYKQLNVSGVQNIQVSITVNGIASVLEAELNGENAIIRFMEEDGKVLIKLLSGENELISEDELAERGQTPIPEYDLDGGYYDSAQRLTFTKDEETLIYYTTDGSEPNRKSGTLYTLPISINRTMTVKAIAVKYGFEDSDVLTLEYTLPQVAAPTANYEEGSYDTALFIDLYSEDPDAEILFTTDGSDPLNYGMVFGSSIVALENMTVRACAVKNGCISETVQWGYQVAPKDRFLLINAPINQDGDPVVSDNIAATETVTINVVSPSKTEQLGHFGIAFYDGNGDLVAFEEQDMMIPEDGGNVIFQITQDVSTAIMMEVYIDKYMVVVKNGYGTGHYAAGDRVTVTASNSVEGYLAKWIGGEMLSLLYGNESSKNLIFTMPASSVSLTAKYKPNPEEPDFSIPDLVLPESLIEIEDYAFEGVPATVVYVPDSCIHIDRYAFSNSAVSQIRIPETCELEENIFDGCDFVYIYGFKNSDAEEYCNHHDNCLFVEYSQ